MSLQSQDPFYTLIKDTPLPLTSLNLYKCQMDLYQRDLLTQSIQHHGQNQVAAVHKSSINEKTFFDDFMKYEAEAVDFYNLQIQNSLRNSTLVSLKPRNELPKYRRKARSSILKAISRYGRVKVEASSVPSSDQIVQMLIRKNQALTRKNEALKAQVTSLSYQREFFRDMTLEYFETLNEYQFETDPYLNSILFEALANQKEEYEGIISSLKESKSGKY